MHYYFLYVLWLEGKSSLLEVVDVIDCFGMTIGLSMWRMWSSNALQKSTLSAVVIIPCQSNFVTLQDTVLKSFSNATSSKMLLNFLLMEKLDQLNPCS